MTRHDDGTIPRHGNVFSVTDAAALDDQTQELQRPIKSREVLERRQRDRTCPVDDDRTLSRVRSTRVLQRSGRPDAFGPDDSSVWLVAERWVSFPTATFSVELINRPPTGHLKSVELRKHI